MTTNKLDLTAIRKRAEAATEGPWEVNTADSEFAIYFDGDNMAMIEYGSIIDGFSNAEFIAHARQDVPALIAEVERLRAENNRIKEEVGVITFLVRMAKYYPDREEETIKEAVRRGEELQR
jgi:hypothetical protein